MILLKKLHRFPQGNLTKVNPTATSMGYQKAAKERGIGLVASHCTNGCWIVPCCGNLEAFLSARGASHLYIDYVRSTCGIRHKSPNHNIKSWL